MRFPAAVVVQTAPRVDIVVRPWSGLERGYGSVPVYGFPVLVVIKRIGPERGHGRVKGHLFPVNGGGSKGAEGLRWRSSF